MNTTVMQPTASASSSGRLERIAVSVSEWSQKWFPDAYVFAVLALIVVGVAAVAMGVPVATAAKGFGDGFWSLIPFTLQLSVVAISGYVVAVSPPAARLIEGLGRLPKTARGAVALVAFVSLASTLLNWAISLIFSGLLARAIGRRADLRVDYRAMGAAAYLGMGAIWALGISSAPAQLMANPSSLPAGLLQITGVLPFTETIFLWQSLVLTLALTVASMAVAYFSAPTGERIRTAGDLGVDLSDADIAVSKPSRPGEWLEHSPLLTLVVVAISLIWLWGEFTGKSPLLAISNLNTYNFLFLTLGMLLCWRPIRFIRAFYKAVPSIGGMLIQFPLYGGIAYMMTRAATADGQTLSHLIASAFVKIASHDSYPVVTGIYSAVLGFFIPSGGGKWLIEAPYVMQAANELKVHLGWAVQVYNAAEALPNLINPFWMLPLLGVLGLKARDVVGFTFTQLLVHGPLVLLLVWLFAGTLDYVPPVMP
jgi:short-chain fatty acids transporter